MKHSNPLRVLRIILAILFFAPLLLFFLDITDKLSDHIHRFAQIQLIPAILSGLFIFTGIMLLLTLLFGRFYCSTICPAGILQDIINRIYSFRKKKNKGIRRFSYHKPYNWLRYILLAATIGLGVFGIMELCLFLDPYSNFGRIATNLFRPVVIWGNNLLADLFMNFGNYSLYHITNNTLTTSSIILSAIALLVFILMVIFRGRLFCNTLCPVGGLLSLLSRYSIFRVAIKNDSCIQCKACERACKAEAIDVKNMKIDMSRCVGCYNCLSTCNKDSIHYSFHSPFSGSKERAEKEKKSILNTRRAFIATSTSIAAALPLTMIRAEQNNPNGTAKKTLPVTPPGSLNLERFKDKCTACHLCVTQCPSHILKPAGLTYGFGYLLKPYMSYEDTFCNFECTVCTEVCPTGAIKPLTVEEKKTTQVGIAVFNIDLCIVKTENTDCGACSEHCPTQAVHMIPYEGTLTIPKVESEICVGCGGCESICPVRPVRAIIIKSNETHLTAQKPKKEEAIEVEIDGFGF